MNLDDKKMKEIISKLQSIRHIGFNTDNFSSPANEERYQEYLNDYLLKYVTNKNDLNTHIIERELESPEVYAGIYMGEKGIDCHIPTRKTLFHEMLCIHEIAHLIHYYNIKDYEHDNFSEIIPYFNEYEYLRNIHPFYAKAYEAYRLERAIYAAHRIGEIHPSAVHSHIYAYEVLESRKKDYKIDELNKINAEANSLEKKLTKKKYTI